jgi:hypothetical protein
MTMPETRLEPAPTLKPDKLPLPSRADPREETEDGQLTLRGKLLVGENFAGEGGHLCTTYRELSAAIGLLGTAARSDFEVPDFDAVEHLEGIGGKQRREYRRSIGVEQEPRRLTVVERREERRRGQASQISATYEWSDIVANAINSLRKLHSFQEYLATILNPELTLDLAMEGASDLAIEGIAMATRHRDLRRIQANGIQRGVVRFSPLRTVVDRFEEGPTLRRHKFINDVYSVNELRAVVQKHIYTFARTTTVLDTRRIAGEAIPDQERRQQMFNRALQQVSDSDLIANSHATEALDELPF